MSKIVTYLSFNGNCREAMMFYNSCLGGEVYFQTVGDSYVKANMPGSMKEAILHATLRKGDLVLMATDMLDAYGLVRGNAISIMLECQSEAEIRAYYEKLVMGGRAVYPLERTHWGNLFGALTDKYGNQWLVNYKSG
jgi:PhnB protein